MSSMSPALSAGGAREGGGWEECPLGVGFGGGGGGITTPLFIQRLIHKNVQVESLLREEGG